MKLMFNYIYILGLILFLQSCGSSVDAAKVVETNQLVESMQFKIQHDWANSIVGGRINLISNPNFIRFKEDSVNLFLPYFGERHSGGGYNTEGGLVYEGPLEELEVSTENRNIQIEFSADQGTERLNFIITVYPEGSVDTKVNSSERSFISYQGEISELEGEQKD